MVSTLNMPLPHGVVFDLDGTLIDSRADILRACNHVLALAGREPLRVGTISSFAGDGAHALLARAFGVDESAPELEQLCDEWHRYYLAHPVDQTVVMPGAVRALRELEARTIGIAVVTNKARAVALSILEALGIATQLRALYAGGDGPLKPHPKSIVVMAQALQVAAKEVWVIGDGPQDIHAAHAAGAKAIAIAGGFNTKAMVMEAHPDAYFESLDAFVDALPPRVSVRWRFEA